jgi:DNA-binding transcriptional regulator GbsR (MarR family)
MIKTDNSKVIENLEKRIQKTKEQLFNIYARIEKSPQNKCLKQERNCIKASLLDLEQWLSNMKEIQKLKQKKKLKEI